MLHYFPMPAFPDTMPIDISHVFEPEKPAGKHGFVQKMPTTCEDGWIRFTIGDPMAPACYYLIFKE